MGYYTRFALSTRENKYKVMDIMLYMKKKLAENDCFYPFNYKIDNLLFNENSTDFTFDFCDEVKWYEYHEEMIKLSKQFPETVFCLYGEGEEGGDMWHRYYKNGKSQYCPAKIVFDEYDEHKLL